MKLLEINSQEEFYTTSELLKLYGFSFIGTVYNFKTYGRLLFNLDFEKKTIRVSKEHEIKDKKILKADDSIMYVLDDFINFNKLIEREEYKYLNIGNREEYNMIIGIFNSCKFNVICDLLDGDVTWDKILELKNRYKLKKDPYLAHSVLLELNYNSKIINIVINDSDIYACVDTRCDMSFDIRDLMEKDNHYKELIADLYYKACEENNICEKCGRISFLERKDKLNKYINGYCICYVDELSLDDIDIEYTKACNTCGHIYNCIDCKKPVHLTLCSDCHIFYYCRCGTDPMTERAMKIHKKFLRNIHNNKNK